MDKNIRNIVILLVLLTGVMRSFFAYSSMHDASKVSIEKSAEGCINVKAIFNQKCFVYNT